MVYSTEQVAYSNAALLLAESAIWEWHIIAAMHTVIPQLNSGLWLEFMYVQFHELWNTLSFEARGSWQKQGMSLL